MSIVQTTATAPKGKQQHKRPFTTPQIRRVGNITGQTRQGGSSKEYDSYSENRP